MTSLVVLVAVLAASAVLVLPARGPEAGPGAGVVGPGPGAAGPGAAGPGAAGAGAGQGGERDRAGSAAPGPDPLGRLRARLAGRAAWQAEEIRLLDSLAAGLEAGLPTERALSVSLEGAGARRPRAWQELERAAAQGLALAPAWSRVARRSGSSSAAAVARAWSVAATTGAPLAAAVRSSAAAARERQRLRQAIRTATAGARATVLVLTLLPVAGVGMATLIGMGPTELYASPLSLGAGVVGLALLVVGHLVVRALVARVLRGLA